MQQGGNNNLFLKQNDLGVIQVCLQLTYNFCFSRFDYSRDWAIPTLLRILVSLIFEAFLYLVVKGSERFRKVPKGSERFQKVIYSTLKI